MSRYSSKRFVLPLILLLFRLNRRCDDLLWHAMSATTDDTSSSKFMFAPTFANSLWLCASDVQGFSREKGLLSQIWALSCDDRQTYAELLFQQKRQPHVTLSYDSRGGGGRDITLAWVGVTLHSHYSKCFAVGGPLPFIFCGIQRGQQNARQLRKTGGEKLNSIRLCANQNRGVLQANANRESKLVWGLWAKLNKDK